MRALEHQYILDLRGTIEFCQVLLRRRCSLRRVKLFRSRVRVKLFQLHSNIAHTQFKSLGFLQDVSTHVLFGAALGDGGTDSKARAQFDYAVKRCFVSSRLRC